MIEFSDIIMLAVLAAFLAAIGLIKKYVSPYFETLMQEVKSSLDDEQLEKVEYWASIFVSAAEMLFKGTSRGTEKKSYVVEQLTTLGFEVGEKENAVIEAKVYELNSEKE